MGNIIVFCAHDDDFAVGALGTILKEIDNGNNVLEVIFSAGQKSHPHYKEEVISRKRANETLSVNEKLKVETLFLGLDDAKLAQVIDTNVKNKIREVIQNNKPEKIFVDSQYDPHPDHRAVFKCVDDVLKEMRFETKVYSYEVWNLLKENKPVVYEDISNYFLKKINIMKQYKTQLYFMYVLMLPVYIRSKLYGRKIKVKYAEKFYRVK
ncbi:PIG-L family deacetylase [Candidatus Woesearchaeota archaeon]|nr:PIG-L family deacetylase [Candidatus Woesearchaeota archaeon]